MQNLKPYVIVCTAALFIGASDVDKFYHAVPHRTTDAPVTVDPNFHQSSGDAQNDVAAMATSGFELIGYSAFNGKEAGEKNVRKEAKKIGASDVIYLEKYTDTQSAGAIGNTSFSRWGAFSVVSPMTVRRYDQLAMYFRKAPREGLGIYPRPLSDDEKVRIGSNKGVVIVAVTNGSPAFNADVLPGDIIVQLNNHPLWDSDSVAAAIDSARGKTTEIQIVRGGQEITKQIAIPAGKW